MDHPTDDPAGQAKALIAAATSALDEAAAVADSTNLSDLVPLLDDLTEARNRLNRAVINSAERHVRALVGMTDEPGWHEAGGVFDAVDAAWEITVVVDDERNPQVEVNASGPVEANRRAVTWARLERNLGEALPADSPRLRVQGSGTRQVSEGRWHVGIEGW